MTPGGWINLSLSIGFVLGLFLWCSYRLLKAPKPPAPPHPGPSQE